MRSQISGTKKWRGQGGGGRGDEGVVLRNGQLVGPSIGAMVQRLESKWVGDEGHCCKYGVKRGRQCQYKVLTCHPE